MAPSIRPWRLRAAMTSRLISRPASLRNLPPRHRLQISDRRQRKGLRPGELRDAVPSEAGMGDADRRPEPGLGAQRIAAGDEGEIVGAAAQFVDEIGDQIVEPAGFADQADERLARNGFGGGEDRGFDAQHPFAPAGGGRQVDEFDVEVFVSVPSAAARGGGHRPYSRNVGRPESSRAAPSTTSRSNSRRAARPVIGAWRAASAGETQSWASRRSTIFWAGFERSLGATAIRVLERRARSAARSRAAAAASAIAPAAAFGHAGSPGLGRRPALGDRRVGSRIFVAISGTGRGQRSRMARAMSNTQSAKISAWGAGASGTAAERQGGGLCGRGKRIALPYASLEAQCEAVRVHGQVQPRRRVANPAGVEAGRPAGAIAPERQEVRRRAERVADGEAEVAQRRFVGVEAQDFGGGRGAVQRQAGAQRPGGGRLGAQKGVEQREAGAGGEQRIALPCPSARPRPGRHRRRWRNGLRFRGFRRGSASLARAVKRRGRAPPSVRNVVGSRSGRRESLAW